MKVVVISQRVDEIKEYGEMRDALDERWYKLFQEMNTILLPIPNILENYKIVFDRIKPDAIVLSGGNSPMLYGGTAPQRDKTDKALIQIAIERKIPLLGVCRGMQSIALYFGGSLKKVNHHVAVEHKIYGKFLRKVNSYHSYAIDKIIDELEILAKDKDGIIEAIRHRQYAIYGIMWHPERAESFHEEDIELIKEWLKL